MPVNLNNPAIPPTVVRPSDRPELRDLAPLRTAQETKSKVKALADEVKSWDNKSFDHWKKSDEVLVHGQDYNRNLLQRLFGTGEQISARAEYKDGELTHLEASVYDVNTSAAGSRARKYKYEKRADGSELFSAPNRVERYTERVEIGRSKVSSYYRDVSRVAVYHTEVLESPNGTLTIDSSGSPSLPNLLG